MAIVNAQSPQPPLWAAPTPSHPIDAAISVPGSKSMTNRALVLSALATGPSTIRGALRSRDTELMMTALRAMGVDIQETPMMEDNNPSPGQPQTTMNLHITPPSQLHGATVDCGLAGTVMRFLPPLAALADGPVRFDGDPHARTRPLQTLVTALRTLGVTVEGDSLPLTVTPTYTSPVPETPPGGNVHIDASSSSQFVSGLLLSAARFTNGITVTHTGPPIPSQPHIAMTIAMLHDAGVDVTMPTPHTWQVQPGPIQPHEWIIEPDLSNATPFMAAAAVTGGRIVIRHWPTITTQPGDRFRTILEHMGAHCTRTSTPHHDLIVTGPPTRRHHPHGLTGITIDLHDIGELRFDGDPHARTRPLQTLVTALRTLGVTVEGDSLPLTVTPTYTSPVPETPPGGNVHIDASSSSQFVSGLLLSAARFTNGITVTHTGPPIPSQPHIAMTIAMLHDAGVDVTMPTPHTWQVQPGPIQPHEWIIEPDLSNATPFMAAAAVTGGRIVIRHWPTITTQPGDRFRTILEHMGAHCTRTSTPHHDLIVTGPPTRRHHPHGLTGITIDLHDIGELTPTIAAVAALADTPSHLTGIAHLRGHETDRLHALASNLNALGGDVIDTDDGLIITPAPLHGGTWPTYGDHRMATAGAIIGAAIPGLKIENIDTTSKTFPHFDQAWMQTVALNNNPLANHHAPTATSTTSTTTEDHTTDSDNHESTAHHQEGGHQ